MDDVETIGQWANNENTLCEIDATKKISLTSQGGTSQLMGWSLLSPEAQRQSSASMLNTKSGSGLEQSREKSASTLKFPPLKNPQRGKSKKQNSVTRKSPTAAVRRASSSSTSKKLSQRQLKATGSPVQTPTKVVKHKKDTVKRKDGIATASRITSRSSTGKSPGRSNLKRQKGLSRLASASSGRSSRTSPARSQKSSKGNNSSRTSSKIRSSKGNRKGDKKGTKKGKTKKTSHGNCRESIFLAALASLTAMETEQRAAIIEEEEAAYNCLLPDYNILAMNIVRAQLQEVNMRQRFLNDAFTVFQNHGIQLSPGIDTNTAIDALRARVRSEMQNEIDDVRVKNLSLQRMLDETKEELEKKNAELQALRDSVNRKLMRFEVESEALKAEVQSVLCTNHLDVDRMKRELGHRLDVATAAIRTPQYDTALRSMQELVRSVQEEIQDHHDTMTKLIVYIGAQDTFLRDKSESMHSNFPQRYRDELRKLEKDRLLNLLDVLSFNDSSVETVGKMLYVMQKTEHQTNVF